MVAPNRSAAPAMTAAVPEAQVTDPWPSAVPATTPATHPSDAGLRADGNPYQQPRFSDRPASSPPVPAGFRTGDPGLRCTSLHLAG